MKLLTGIAAFVAVALSFGTNCRNKGVFMKGSLNGATQVPENFKVVFLGDQGLGSNPTAVLKQVKAWGANIVIHAGDFDYDRNPTAWDDQINSVLGEDFPYFAAIGNHDNLNWSGRNGYESKLLDRFERINATQYCSGEIGVRMACNYDGFLFILSGVGTRGDDHPEYFDEIFSQTSNIWKNVNWHKNQRLYQCGDKINEVGYEVYDTARKYGAIVATAHEHSYCRSYLMSDFSKQSIASKDNNIYLSPGKSFVFVSGLGGKSIRSYEGGREENEWWAATAASDDDVSDGALYCTFNVDKNPRKAKCEFLDRLGKVWDTFEIYTQLEGQEVNESVCTPRFDEYQVSSTFDDVVENEKEERETRSEIVSVVRGQKAALRFRNVSIKDVEKISEVHLQVLSAKDAGEEPSLFVRGLKKNVNGALKNFSKLKLTESFVEWADEDDNWDAETVWVSPDLSEIVREIVSQPTWTDGDDITLILSTDGERKFFSFDKSECFAPSLTIEYKNDC